MPGRPPSAPRCAALVGPYGSGKTSLLECLLFKTDAIKRKGDVKAGTAVGDQVPEAKAHEMGVEMTVATTTYLGDEWTFLDCPGSVEFAQDTALALQVVDTAIVVVEPEPGKVMLLAPLLHMLNELSIPHMFFINKMDIATAPLKEVLEALKTVSQRPLVLREIPITKDGVITGFVDLVSERAWHYRSGKLSEMIDMPAEVADSEHAAREAMLEAAADFDDVLLEQIIEEILPPPETIYTTLATELQEDLVAPVFFGSATEGNGITRLLKALRHEAPEPMASAARLGLPTGTGGLVARVFRTAYPAQVGKLSYVRVFEGELESSQTTTLGEEELRIGTMHTLMGQERERAKTATLGQVVAVGRVDELQAGVVLGGQEADWIEPLEPVYERAISIEKRSDEVKLSGALHKLLEEDPSLTMEHREETGELVLMGQGDLHLTVSLERLKNRHGLEVDMALSTVAYKETIRGSVTQHSRFKRQTGGHGQFGDVHLEIGPNTKGEGLNFSTRITGGVVPKRFFPGVEGGVVDSLKRGPFGFPVVDVAVTLVDGAFHAVDSSEMAFKTAASMAMREGMAKCAPVLLEPIYDVTVDAPSEHASRIQRILATHRGQVSAFEPRQGWPGWDRVQAQMPRAEMAELILELRAMTQGLGTFVGRFSHLQDLTGRTADEVVAARQEALKGVRI